MSDSLRREIKERHNLVDAQGRPLLPKKPKPTQVVNDISIDDPTKLDDKTLAAVTWGLIEECVTRIEDVDRREQTRGAIWLLLEFDEIAGRNTPDA